MNHSLADKLMKDKAQRRQKHKFYAQFCCFVLPVSIMVRSRHSSAPFFQEKKDFKSKDWNNYSYRLNELALTLDPNLNDN